MSRIVVVEDETAIIELTSISLREAPRAARCAGCRLAHRMSAGSD